MIEVKNLTKVYGNFVAVKDVSFKAENGSILGFLALTAPARPPRCASSLVICRQLRARAD